MENSKYLHAAINNIKTNVSGENVNVLSKNGSSKAINEPFRQPLKTQARTVELCFADRIFIVK